MLFIYTILNNIKILKINDKDGNTQISKVYHNLRIVLRKLL